MSKDVLKTWPESIYLGDFLPAKKLYAFSEFNTEIVWTAHYTGEVCVEYVRKDLVKEMK